MKCCKNCHHLVEGNCYCKEFIAVVGDTSYISDNMIAQVFSNGRLESIIKRVFNEVGNKMFKSLETLIYSWGISQRRVSVFNKRLGNAIDRQHNKVCEKLIEEVSSEYEDWYFGDLPFVEIQNLDFCCKYWS